jgi:hypothetical protein
MVSPDSPCQATLTCAPLSAPASIPKIVGKDPTWAAMEEQGVNGVAALLAEGAENVDSTADTISDVVVLAGLSVLAFISGWKSMCRQVLRRETGELHGPWWHDFGPAMPLELKDRTGRVRMGTRRVCRRCGFERVHDPASSD